MRSRLLLVAVAVAGAAPFVAAAWLLGSSGGSAGSVEPPQAEVAPPPEMPDEADMTPQQAEAAAFAAGIREVALAAGSIVELEMKPGISDIREQTFENEVLQGFSDRWANDLARLRDGLAAEEVPAGLEESHRLYVEALDGYREVALLFSQSVQVPVAERDDVLMEAMELGRATDQVWNEGQSLLADFLRALGLDPGFWLPVTN